MRIALVSDSASPLAEPAAFAAGSQNLHVAGLAKALSALGHQVVVYTRRDNPLVPQRVPTDDGYDVVHVPAGPSRKLNGDEVLAYTGDFVAFLELAWKARRPDVVHAHGWLSGIASVLSVRDSQVPVVQTYHSVGGGTRYGNAPVSTKRVAVERLVGHEVARVVATCSAEARAVLGMGVDRSRVTVVPRGVDLDLFAAGRSSTEPGRALRVVSVGRVVPDKGFDSVIRALSTVEGARLVIAGAARGDVRGDPEARRLLDLARSAGIGDRVVLAGPVPYIELPVLLRSADVVACTPPHHSSGGVAIEAMACGVPVVATAVGGLVDSVIDGTTGVLVPPGKPDAIGRALRALLADGAQRELLGAAGHDRAHARYSWHRVAVDLVRTYSEVTGSRTPVASGRSLTHRA